LVYTVTLNPAVDKLLFVEEFIKTRTTRIKKTVETLGGKGTHVSINLKLLGHDSRALGVTLGENGKKVIKMLENWGVDVQFTHYDIEGMESRTNYMIIEEKGRLCTMVTERGPMLPVSFTEALEEKMTSLLCEGDILVLTGDASNVEDTQIYTKLTLSAKARGAKVFLDASGKYLADGLASKPYLIKPNLEELSFLTGKEIHDEAQIVSALQGLDGSGIEIIAMTWSGEGAVVKAGKEIYRVWPAKVNVANEIGCGDAFISGFIAALLEKRSMEDTLRYASAAGGAAAESEDTVGFDVARFNELKNQIKVKKLA
jgi:1-phosphofructokinase family hexose kinase